MITVAWEQEDPLSEYMDQIDGGRNEIRLVISEEMVYN